MNYDPSMLAHCLPDYYKLLFPFKPFCKWLCYGQKPSAYFSYREFAFIFEGDVHIRYRSFNDMLEFEKELCKSSPFKLDIGAIYNHKPKDNKKFSDFRAEQRELVFDIDLTDYDEIRKCCSGANVCKKCCRWITIAMKVLDRLLKEHFGFKHRLWVFSGRRGVHCWVADAEARKLTNPGRAAVASYLSLISSQQNIVNVSEKKGFVHPVISDAYQFIMETGEVDRMVVEQGWLSGEEGLSALTEGCKDDNVINELKSIINDVMRIDSIEQQWLALRIKLDNVKRKEMMAQKGVELCKAASPEAVDHFRGFVLYHTYPRLDVNVSTATNHLLKSPFCIHPKTGRVAVPITPEQMARIDLENLPRIDGLLNELSKTQVNDEQNENRKLLGYKHTSLAPYVEHFEAFVNNLLRDCTNSG